MRKGSSGLLGAWGEDHRGGEAVDAQSRDVDLITAISGKLEGELGWGARRNGTERAPEVDGGRKRTGSQQHRSQSVGGDDRWGEGVSR